jgi:hypothetical protein
MRRRRRGCTPDSERQSALQGRCRADVLLIEQSVECTRDRRCRTAWRALANLCRRKSARTTVPDCTVELPIARTHPRNARRENCSPNLSLHIGNTPNTPSSRRNYLAGRLRAIILTARQHGGHKLRLGEVHALLRVLLERIDSVCYMLSLGPVKPAASCRPAARKVRHATDDVSLDFGVLNKSGRDADAVHESLAHEVNP